MELGFLSIFRRPKVKRRAILVAASLLLIWLTFFDSHSFSQRFRWHRELSDLQGQNEELRKNIERLEADLENGLSDERVEQIAREQYHMKKPGETVHQIEKEK